MKSITKAGIISKRIIINPNQSFLDEKMKIEIKKEFEKYILKLIYLNEGEEVLRLFDKRNKCELAIAKKEISNNPYPKDIFVPSVKNDAIRKLWDNWNKWCIDKLDECFQIQEEKPYPEGHCWEGLTPSEVNHCYEQDAKGSKNSKPLKVKKSFVTPSSQVPAQCKDCEPYSEDECYYCEEQPQEQEEKKC